MLNKAAFIWSKIQQTSKCEELLQFKNDFFKNITI